MSNKQYTNRYKYRKQTPPQQTITPITLLYITLFAIAYNLLAETTLYKAIIYILS